MVGVTEKAPVPSVIEIEFVPQVSVPPQLTAPEKVPVDAFTGPHVSVFEPIPREVFSVDPFQQHLNTSVFPVALKEFKVANPPTFCCIPPPRAPPYEPYPIYI